MCRDTHVVYTIPYRDNLNLFKYSYVLGIRCKKYSFTTSQQFIYMKGLSELRKSFGCCMHGRGMREIDVAIAIHQRHQNICCAI